MYNHQKGRKKSITSRKSFTEILNEDGSENNLPSDSTGAGMQLADTPEPVQ